MSEQLPERLDGDVSISASIEKTGLTAAAKGRTFVAIDRLIGGAIDIFAAKVEGVRNRELLDSQVQATALQIAADRYLANVENIPDLARRGLRHMLREEARKQANREAVAGAAIEQLALPPPSTSNASGPISDDAQLDEDWLNVFSRHVENASTERFQILWGQILAGEIRRPGSFSLTTLRVISELDSRVAQLFEQLAVDRVDQNIPSALSLEGPRLADAGLLVEAGLIQDTGDTVHIHFTRGHNLSSENFVLTFDIPEGGSFDLPIIPLTRAGYEIARVLPQDEMRAIRRAAAMIRGSFKISLHAKRPHPDGDGRLQLKLLEVLREPGEA